MHIVCHMAASVDGRLHPSRWSPFVEDCSVGGVYEEVANQYGLCRLDDRPRDDGRIQ